MDDLVIFGEEGGVIKSLIDGSETPFGVEDSGVDDEGGIYVMDLWLPPEGQGLGRQGS